MRESLTFLGIVLIALLTAALAAPVFVDFNAHRAAIAEKLTQASGAQVTLAGPLSLRLFPVPELIAEKIEIAGTAGSIKAAEARFELALMALLQGRLQFTQAGFEDAEIQLDPARLALARNPGDRVQFEHLQLRRAHLIVMSGGAAVFELDDLNLAASAPSLDGPFQGEGGASVFGMKIFSGKLAGERTFGALSIGGTDFSFRFSTERFAKGLLPLKAMLKIPDAGTSLELDGRLSGGAEPSFAGQAKAGVLADKASASVAPWQAQAALTANLRGADVSAIEAHLGEGIFGAKLTGAGRLDGATQKISLNLATSRIDAAVLQKLESLASGAGKLQTDSSLVADVLNGGGIDWSNVRIGLQSAPGAAPQLQAQAEGPGGFRLAAAGAWTGAEWRGQGSVQTDDLPEFAAALREAAPEAARELASLPVRRLSGQGGFVVSADHFAASATSLRLDRSQLEGALDYQAAGPGRRARLVVRVASRNLDLDAAPDLTSSALADLDLDLALEARAVKLERGGQNFTDAGRISAHFTRSGEAVQLEHLDLTGIGGADLSASGQRRAGESPSGALRLTAPDLSELARLVGRVAPGAFADFLAAHARDWSPASLTAAFDGTPAAGGKFDFGGTLAATHIQAQFAALPQGRLSGAVAIAAPEAGLLLQQLGAPLLTAAALGPAHFSAQAHGAVAAPAQGHVSAPAQGDVSAQGLGASDLTFTAAADLAGLHGLAEGRLAEAFTRPVLTGDLTFTGDAAPLLAHWGAPLHGAAPGRLSTRLEWSAGALRLRQLAGLCDNVAFSGELARQDGAISGALRLDSLSLANLASLVLGPPEPAKSGALRSSLKFAPVLFDPPRAQIALDVQSLTIDPPLVGHAAHFDLLLDPNRLTISRLGMEVAGGRLQGGFDLRRDGVNVTLSGEAEGRGLSLRSPAFAATMDGGLRWAGSGQSASALAGSLAGDGSVQMRGLAIAAAASDAPDKVLAASEASDDPFDPAALAKALNADFAQGAAALGAADFSASLAGGRLDLTSADRKAPAFSLDLRDKSLDIALTVAAQNTPRGWDQPKPDARVVWSGPLAAPMRRVDADSFVNALAARALVREQAQIDAQKFDLRERGFFRRRLNADRWQDLRRQEITADEIRRVQETRKRDEEAKREEERTKNRMEQLKAAAVPDPRAPPSTAPESGEGSATGR